MTAMSSLLVLISLALTAHAQDDAAPSPAPTSTDAPTGPAPSTEAAPAPAEPPAAAPAPAEAPAPAASTAEPSPAPAPATPAPTATSTAATPATTASPPPALTPEQLKAQAEDPPAPPLAPGQITAVAEKEDPFGKKMLRMLKPSPYHLPQNPRGHVDFTAYTLEFGEVKLGVANMTIGVLPHVQAGTSVPLDVLGIPNVTAKIHATEGGPFDIAAYGNYYALGRQNVNASYLGVGGITSFRLAEPWSLHVGGGYTRLAADAELDFATVGELLSGQKLENAAVGLMFEGEAATARIASDVRLNRRDSIILQAEAIVWGRSSNDVPDAVIDFLNLDEATSHNGPVPLGEALTASVAWHFAWKHLEARIGVGWSSVPGAWLLQSTELSYRFGGKTRVKERKMREGWEGNQEEARTFRADEKRRKKEEKRSQPSTPAAPAPATTPAP
jgi:hypothetical protein